MSYETAEAAVIWGLLILLVGASLLIGSVLSSIGTRHSTWLRHLSAHRRVTADRAPDGRDPVTAPRAGRLALESEER